MCANAMQSGMNYYSSSRRLLPSGCFFVYALCEKIEFFVEILLKRRTKCDIMIKLVGFYDINIPFKTGATI